MHTEWVHARSGILFKCADSRICGKYECAAEETYHEYCLSDPDGSIPSGHELPFPDYVGIHCIMIYFLYYGLFQ